MFCRLEDVLDCLSGDWFCSVDGQKISIDGADELKRYKNYLVMSIRAQENCIVLELKPWEPPDASDSAGEAWYEEHVKEFATEPSFF